MLKLWRMKTVGLTALVLLMLAAAGCSPAQTADSDQPGTNQGSAGNGGDDPAPNPDEPSTGEPQPDPKPNDTDTNTPPQSGDNEQPELAPGGEPAGEEPADNGKDPDSAPDEAPAPVAENEAFRIFEPAEGTTIDSNFVVKGQARVFEAAFSYTFEDGHEMLDEGHVMASVGAPEWGDFEFTVDVSGASSNTGTLTIYEISAKDGSKVHQLTTTVTLDAKLLQPAP
ncbi:hypothetical protein FHS18_002756 [Paenibacillus phyllosphaerae]|uniref:Bacterial spore germination immunoglobulin-like domain-containing protein n=1 Tax=Paenibacillus phyllosphaerae TaxID=274593 RepID=A0A7W5AXP4_9BACL|nr:Gmad2 immunoglobulin-like domain-containing protein [Paenibacillus phyllosphaerae]MBB3110689.1 hypothetical protein [Paenibacillus phyllosphaerae]